MNLLKLIIKRFHLLFMPAILLVMGFATTSGPTSMTQEAWTQSQFQQLTLAERIGQLFMVATYSNKEGEQHQQHQASIEHLIREYNIGGLIFFQGSLTSQAKLTNHYQSITKTPLLLAMDAEWGLGMRLRDTISYPRQMTLGAIQNNQLIYEMGAEIARQLKLLGVHINLAPVMDINTNPDNPGVGNRSFGDSKGIVASKGLAYIQGLQNNGVLAVAKHFPGLGETSKDSHLELPILLQDTARLEHIELYPFSQAIEAGVAGIMVAHTYIPAYDTTANRATSLSPKLVTELLKQQLGFQGLVFTDALNMKAVSKYYQPGEVDLLALQAGNDVLLFPEDVPKAIALIKAAIEEGKLDETWVDQRVKKILAAKYQVNLHQWNSIKLEGLNEKINTSTAKLLKQRLFEEAITLVSNQDNLIPITNLKKHQIASLSIVKQADANKRTNSDTANKKITPTISPTTFSQFLGKYAPVTNYTLNRVSLDMTMLQQLTGELEKYSLVIVDLHNLSGTRSNQFGLEPELLQFLTNLQQLQTKVVLVVFGSVYSLELFQHMDHLIAAYQDDPVAEQVVPQIIFGALPAVGNLPVHISNAWKSEWGIKTNSLQRLGYTLPEAVQVDSKVLQTMDKLIEKAIGEGAMPGCQVLVARHGKVVLEKAYGFHTYSKENPVTTTTLYDIASLTKVSGTLQALMYLASIEKLVTRQKASFYLPELKGTDKKNLRINHILAHQSGLAPYYHQAIKEKVLQENAVLNSKLFSHSPSATYNNQLGSNLYTTPWLKDFIWDLCMQGRLRKKKRFKSYTYEYSCIGFYIMHKIVEKLVEQPMEIFLDDYFYKPLGCNYITYRPLQKFTLDAIAPTEEYDFFRNSIIHGIVHDPQAAMYGGVAGNAGLFSNANDLAMILQMNLQDGYYGGERYLKQGIIQQFTTKVLKKNRRGLGWDKPAIKGAPNLSTYASATTYGHLGFTGIAAWVDPKYDLIYIFLSNRTYPTSDNKKLMEQNIRIKIQDIVYQALQDVA